MKFIFALSMSLSSLAFGAMTQEDLTALKAIHHYFVQSEPPQGDGYAQLMCPEVIGISVDSKGVQVLEHLASGNSRIGNYDPEVSYTHYAWNFEAKDINGGGHKWTSWNEIGGGLFSRSQRDPLFRNAVLQVKNTLTTTPHIRLVQEISITPYTLAFVRAGKVRTITSELIQTTEGVMMRRRVDGVERRSCRYKLPVKK